jgi:hypothetical protein
MSKVGDKYAGIKFSDIRDNYDKVTTDRYTSLNNYYDEYLGTGIFDPQVSKTFKSKRHQSNSFGSLKELDFLPTKHMIVDDPTRGELYAEDMSDFPLSSYGLEIELVMVADDSVDIYIKNSNRIAMALFSNLTVPAFEDMRAAPDDLETKTGFFGLGFSYEPAPTWDDDPNGDITFNNSDLGFRLRNGFDSGNYHPSFTLYTPNTYSTYASNPDVLNRLSVGFVADPPDDIRQGTSPFNEVTGSVMLLYPNTRYKLASGVGNLPWPEKKIIERKDNWTGDDDLYPYTIPVGSADSTIKDIYINGISKINYQKSGIDNDSTESSVLRRFSGTAKKEGSVRRQLYKGIGDGVLDFNYNNIHLDNLDLNNSMAVFVLTLSFDSVEQARDTMLGTNHGYGNETLLLTKEMLLRSAAAVQEKGFITRYNWPRINASSYLTGNVNVASKLDLNNVIVKGDLTLQDDGTNYSGDSTGTGVVLIFYKNMNDSSSVLINQQRVNPINPYPAYFSFGGSDSQNTEVNHSGENKHWSTNKLRDSEESPLLVEQIQGSLYTINGVDTREGTIEERSFVHRPHSSQRVSGDPDQSLRKTLTMDGELLSLSGAEDYLAENEYCVIGGVSGATPVEAGTLTGFSNAVPDWLFDSDGNFNYPTQPSSVAASRSGGQYRTDDYHGVHDTSLSLSAEIVNFGFETSFARYGDPYGGNGYIYPGFSWPDYVYARSDDRINFHIAAENSPNPYKFSDQQGWSGDDADYTVRRDKSIDLTDLPNTTYWAWPSPSSFSPYIQNYASDFDFNYLHGVVNTTAPISMVYHTKAVEAVPRSGFTDPRGAWDSYGYAYNGDKYVFDITYNGYKLFDHSQNGSVTTFDIEGDMHALTVTTGTTRGNYRIEKILNSDPDESNPISDSVGREVDTWRNILDWYKTGHNRGYYERLIGHRSSDSAAAISANRYSRFIYPENPSYAKNYPNEGNILEYNLTDRAHCYAGGTFDSALTDGSIGCDAYALFAGTDAFSGNDTAVRSDPYRNNAPARYRANSRYANVLSLLALKWDTKNYFAPSYGITRNSIKNGYQKGTDDCLVQNFTTHPHVVDEYSSGYKSASLPWGDDYRETFTRYPGAHPNLISQQNCPVDCETFFKDGTVGNAVFDFGGLVDKVYDESELLTNDDGVQYLPAIELGFAWRIVCTEIDPEDNCPVYELYVSSANNIHGFGFALWDDSSSAANTASATLANIIPDKRIFQTVHRAPNEGTYSPVPLDNNGKRVEKLICRFKPAKRNARNTKDFGADQVIETQGDSAPNSTQIAANYESNQDFRNTGIGLSYQTTYPKYQIVTARHSDGLSNVTDQSVGTRSASDTGLYANDKFRNSIVTNAEYKNYHGQPSGLDVSTIIDDYPDLDPTYPVSVQKETHNIDEATHNILNVDAFLEPPSTSAYDDEYNKFLIATQHPAYVLKFQEFLDKVLVRTVFNDDSSDVGIQFSSKNGNALEISFVTSDMHNLNSVQTGHILFTTYFRDTDLDPLTASSARLHVKIPEQLNNTAGGGHVIQIPAEGFTSTYWAEPYPDNTIANRGSKDTAIEFGDNADLPTLADNFFIGLRHLHQIDEIQTGIHALSELNDHPDNISKFPLKVGPIYAPDGNAVYQQVRKENQIYGGTKGQTFIHGFKSLNSDRSESDQSVNDTEYQRQSYPIKGDATNEWSPTSTTLDYYRDGAGTAGSQILNFDPVKVGNRVGAQIGGKFTTKFELGSDVNIGGYGNTLDPATKEEVRSYYDRIQKLSISNIAPLDEHSDGRNLFSNTPTTESGDIPQEEGHDWEPHFNTANVFFRTRFNGMLSNRDTSDRMHILVPFMLDNDPEGHIQIIDDERVDTPPNLVIASPYNHANARANPNTNILSSGLIPFKTDGSPSTSNDVASLSAYYPTDGTGEGHVYSPWFTDRSENGFFGRTTYFDYEEYFNNFDAEVDDVIIEQENAVVTVKRGDLVSFYLAKGAQDLHYHDGDYGVSNDVSPFAGGFWLKHEYEFKKDRSNVVQGVEGNGMPLMGGNLQDGAVTLVGQYIRWDTAFVQPGNYYLVAGQDRPLTQDYAFQYGEYARALYIKIVVTE